MYNVPTMVMFVIIVAIVVAFKANVAAAERSRACYAPY